MWLLTVDSPRHTFLAISRSVAPRHLHDDLQLAGRKAGGVAALGTSPFAHQHPKPLDQLAGDVWIGHRPTIADPVDRSDEILRADVLEDVSACPGFERPERPLFVRSLREHDDFYLRTLLFEEKDRLRGVQSGQVLIEEVDIGIGLS